VTSAFVGRVYVVGAGLIGTSIGLAASAAGADVWLTDKDPARARLAQSLGAGTAGTPDEGVDIAIAAVAPAATGSIVVDLLRADISRVVSHVCSVQAQPQREVEEIAAQSSNFLGSHPIAGREVTGPAAARADLFHDRAWVLCPTGSTAPSAVELMTSLVSACGAHPIVMTATEHDEALARTSHVPQLVASALAAALVPAGPQRVALAGSGLRDTTRLADSSPQMWGEIVAANSAAVAAALREVADPLIALAEALATDSSNAGATVAGLVERGRQGRQLLPGKHGGAAVPLAAVSVVISDQPGTLARLFADVAAGSVNIEDFRVEHAHGQPLGVVELLVAPGDQARLVQALETRGWSAAAD
jgi:prephenate dehydrogenase